MPSAGPVGSADWFDAGRVVMGGAVDSGADPFGDQMFLGAGLQQRFQPDRIADSMIEPRSERIRW